VWTGGRGVFVVHFQARFYLAREGFAKS
jgi:hypothetical protein